MQSADAPYKRLNNYVKLDIEFLSFCFTGALIAGAKYGFTRHRGESMGAYLDSVGDILSRVEKRVEVAAQNLSNATTPGYKRAISFESLVAIQGAGKSGEGALGGTALGPSLTFDFTPGKSENTHNPNDLAISGSGFFTVKTTDGQVLYTRQGQFQRNAEGQLVTPQGDVVQESGGGDLALKPGAFTVQSDGTVIQAGEPVGRLGIVDLSDATAVRLTADGLYSAPDSAVTDMDSATVRQGALEASNVSLGPEMLTIMAALRQAQSGQQLMNTYDDLMGKVISTFGQG